MIPDRRLFGDAHRLFREQVRRFFAAELTPNLERWQTAGALPKDFWRRCGAQGLLAPTAAEAYGGVGADFLYNTVVTEELSYTGASPSGLSVHNDVVTDYIAHYGSESLKQRLLPNMVAGDTIGAIAMTEPGTGSDLQNIRSTAKPNGNGYIVSGQKTFISNGQNAGAVIAAVKTDPNRGAKGVSLIVIEDGMPGFERGRNLRKMGNKDQDTSELFFNDVKAPAENLLGGEGQGFALMMQELPQERIAIAVSAVAAAQKAYDITLDYVRERQAFGKAIADFQNTRYTLAGLKTELAAGWAFLDECLAEHLQGRLSVTRAAMAKLWCTEMQGRVTDACVQLFGGYGYMDEYEISRLYTAARVQRIYGGTSEIMKELIARDL